MEIGDSFKFKPTNYNKGCYYIDKIYIIKSFSKSNLSVYYEFNVSNKRCKCYQCSNRTNGVNCTGKLEIYIHQTKKEKQRLIRINKILKGVSI